MEATTSRTLVKSKPELWQLLSSEELMRRCAAEVVPGNGTDLEVLARDPEERLAWRSGNARIEVELESKGFGTQVSLAATSEAEQLEEGALERILDELGEAQRRPFSAD
jgi:hypothetical protein